MFKWLGKVFHTGDKLEPVAMETGASGLPATTSNCAAAEERKTCGNTHFSKGELDRAAVCYRQAIELNPAYADAYNNLGLVFREQKQYTEAEQHLKQAVTRNPRLANAHYNLGLVTQEQGRTDEALAHYKVALEIQPDYAEAWLARGSLLYLAGHNEEAAAAFQRIIALKPGEADAHFLLGKVRVDQNNCDEAVKCFAKVVALQPGYAEAYLALGAGFEKQKQCDDAIIAYKQAVALDSACADAYNNLTGIYLNQGKPEESLACLRKLLALKPDYAGGYNNLGLTYQALGQIDSAVASYAQALELEPDYAEAHNNLGIALQTLKQLDKAAASYAKALEIKPDYAEAHSNLGAALKDLGQLNDAAESYAKALEIKPDYADALNNLGAVLKALGKFDDAVASFRRALEIKPDLAEAHSNLGAAQQVHGQLDDAVASFRQALKIKPNYAEAYDNLLFTLNYHPDMSGEEIFAVYRGYDERFGLLHRGKWRSHGNSREIHRRLKVGYVSPDFRRHSCRHFLEPLLSHHDKNAVEIHAYAELVREDEVTTRYKSYVDHWVLTAGMTDDALSERIRADGIDILVELAGHTDKNRVPVLARKPAPVSLSWLGFGYTTGLTAVEYLLTDAASAPEGCEGLFSESPWRLETPGFAYRPAEGMGRVNPLPALTRGCVTFGTLTRALRINHRTIRVWAEILKRVKDSRLVIDSHNFKGVAMQDILAEKFVAQGIARERLEIGCHSPPWDVLRGLDIGLDCFPHNSGTTLFETLYMGVPFVTLAGRPSVGRLGSSILEGAGHPEWIARTEDEYVEIAVALAADLPKLAALRGGLRQEMETGPLMNEAGFARKVEAAYREMWRRWCVSSPALGDVASDFVADTQRNTTHGETRKAMPFSTKPPQ